MINTIFVIVSVVFAILCIANMIYSIVKFRSRNVESYMKERETRKQEFLNGK